MKKRTLNRRTINVDKETHKNLKIKAKNISKFVNKNVPVSRIVEQMALKPLILNDAELRMLKKWKKF
jgi:hypothetical protein